MRGLQGCGLLHKLRFGLSVRPSVRLSVTTVSRTKTAEPIEMPFGTRSRVGPRNDVLGDDRPRSSMGSRAVVRRGRGFFDSRDASPSPPTFLDCDFSNWYNFGKIIKTVATICNALNSIMLRLRPRPTVGAYSTPPDLLAGSKGPTSKRKEGRKGKGRKEKA